MTVIDTHAGAGAYDLSQSAARRSGEAQAGIARLLAATDAPPALQRLVEAVRRCDRDLGNAGALRWYPGSPRLAIDALRPGDAYVGCELRADDHRALEAGLARRAFERRVRAELLQADGYETAGRLLGTGDRGLLLIDPPFENGDDYERVLALAARLRTAPGVGAAIWLPVKDLETFDRFLRRLEPLALGQVEVAEVRLRPLTDPIRMNGCAMVLVRPPELGDEAPTAAAWIAGALGDIGATAQVFRL